MTWRESYEEWLNSPALSESEWKELDAIINNYLDNKTLADLVKTE